MAVPAGTAWITVLPNMGGFKQALSTGIGAALIGVAASGVKLRAEFEKSLNTVGAVTGATRGEMKALEKAAVDMGNKTVFSANEAAKAMVELAKGGISVADMRAGALKGTLLLAAAGGTDLATAAGIASNALNTFGLKGRDMDKVANALAGGANASTASVESLGQALAQVGPGAKNAGLDINETVGALAAFDNAGIKGSDAGTSLKTMLARLVPQTDAARSAMKKLGLDFTKRNGDFKSLGNISQQLQDKLAGLSDSERTRALSTIFGSDATRAATVLMNEGSKGLGKYVRATKDQKAAQKAANAAMKGLPGALERLSGAWETLRLRIGKALEPGVIAGANILADTMAGLVPFVQQNADTFKVLGITVAIGAALWGGYALGVKISQGWTALHTMWTKRQAIAQALLNRAMMLNPIGLIVGALIALGLGLVIAYKKSETFRRIVDGAWAGIRKAVSVAWHGFIRPALAAFAGFFGKYLMPVIRGLWRGVQLYFGLVRGVIKFAWQNVIRPVFQLWWAYFTRILIPTIKWLWSKAVRPVFDSVKDKIVTVWRKFLRPTLGALRDFVVDKLAPAVSRGIGKIKDVWSSLSSAAKKPVRFLVNTVYNNGIRKMIGALPGVTMPDKVKLGFKDGGPVTGGVRGKDSVRAWLMPGEHVWTAKEVEAAGGQEAMLAMRRAVLRGDLNGDPKFAGGGQLSDAQIARAKRFAKAQAGKPYIWGGVGPVGYDCSGFMSAITNVLRGMAPGSRVGATASFPWPGFVRGPGQFTIGSTRNYGGSGVGHMAGTLAGLNVESRGGQGVVIGAGARGFNDSGFTTVAHLGAGGAQWAKGGPDPGWLSAIKSIVSVAKKAGGWVKELSSMGGWAATFRKMIGSIGDKVVNWLNDKIPNRLLPDNPIPNVFDTGGRLPTGLSLAYNGTGRPETVLTDGQLRTLQAANQASGLPRSLRLVVDGYEFNAYVDARAEDTVTAASQLADMLGRAD